jgi:hypothetical protein
MINILSSSFLFIWMDTIRNNIIILSSFFQDTQSIISFIITSLFHIGVVNRCPPLGFAPAAQLQAASMATPGGGNPPPSSPISAEEAFRRLLASSGKKPTAKEAPKFVKKLDTIPEIEHCQRSTPLKSPWLSLKEVWLANSWGFGPQPKPRITGFSVTGGPI